MILLYISGKKISKKKNNEQKSKQTLNSYSLSSHVSSLFLSFHFYSNHNLDFHKIFTFFLEYWRFFLYYLFVCFCRKDCVVLNNIKPFFGLTLFSNYIFLFIFIFNHILFHKIILCELKIFSNFLTIYSPSKSFPKCIFDKKKWSSNKL